MHAAPPCPPEELLWTVAAARLLLPADIHLQAPPNLSDDLGPLLDAGIDDWGGVSPVTPDHVNPERPWPALDVLRAATEAAGYELAPRLTDLPRVRPGPGAVARPRRAARRAGRVRRRGPGARPRPAGTRAASAAAARASLARRRRASRRGRPRSARCWPAWWPARRWARTRSSPCSAPGAGRWRRWPRWPTTCAGAHRGRRRHLGGQPQHQLHQRVHVQVPVLRLLQGPAVAQPAGRPLPARRRRDPAPGGRGGRRGRHRGVPAGRHPPQLRRRLLHRRVPGGEGGRARHPRPRLHRPGGHRGRPPAGRAAGATTCAG